MDVEDQPDEGLMVAFWLLGEHLGSLDEAGIDATPMLAFMIIVEAELIRRGLPIPDRPPASFE